MGILLNNTINYSYTSALNYNNFTNCPQGIKVVAQNTSGITTLYGNNFSNSNIGLFIDGLTRYDLQYNFFNNCVQGLYLNGSGTTAGNQLKYNEFVGGSYGIKVTGANASTKILSNCFSMININGIYCQSGSTISNDQSYPNASASNCFDTYCPSIVNYGGALNYKYDPSEACTYPHNPYGINLIVTSGSYNNCGSFSYRTSSMITEVVDETKLERELNKLKKIELESKDKKEKDEAIQSKYDLFQKYIFHKASTGKIDEKYLIRLLEKETDFYSQSLLISILFEQRDFEKAKVVVEKTKSNGELGSDYAFAQELMIKYFEDIQNFKINQSDKSKLKSLSEKNSDPFYGHIRAIYYVLTGESILFIDDSKHLQPRNSKQKNIILHPNPSSTFITLEGLEIDSNIKIYNISGILLKSYKTSIDTYQIDISALENGIYLVQIVDFKNETKNLRFIKN